MIKRIDLSGRWNFQLGGETRSLQPYHDTIMLPGTTSFSKKGSENTEAALGHLTDTYSYEGYAWYSRTIEVSEDFAGKCFFIYLERTRMTKLWIDELEVGAQNSLCTPHVYDVTDFLSTGIHTITICVKNTGYPTKGGHLTSPDTQTNWNGITGRIELQIYDRAHITEVQVFPDVQRRSVVLKVGVTGTQSGVLSVSAESVNCGQLQHIPQMNFSFSEAQVSLEYSFGETALLWSEYEPNLYRLTIKLYNNDALTDQMETVIGLREFKTAGDKFTINGNETFLRGKHEAMIFPLTGFAPTTVDEWLRVLNISKSYGINHYRFHTCCPPEAAFYAADMLGIYMEPELPFWGTITDENDENHNAAEQDYLISEGFSILKNFGNHPSFVMLSLGNELWGSKKRINEILRIFRAFDSRPLYTQGSNNFQFVPEILENEDFFCGVRFSKDRLIRGSYAMCDAPLGHVQTDRPCTMKDYDKCFSPQSVHRSESESGTGTIQIQFGTEAKTVKATDAADGLIPSIPVISHEIGQYAVFPNFKEIQKYTGSIKPKNFEVFKKRLEDKGLGDLAEKYFLCSGKLSAACYKEELEAAFRTRKLAGFQLLDLQDFSGQGTALVGMLDAFMDSKGLITPEKWRNFCSQAVLLARFQKFNFTSAEDFHAHVELCDYRNNPDRTLNLHWELKDSQNISESGQVCVLKGENQHYIDLCDINIKMQDVPDMRKLTLSLWIEGTDIENAYDLWLYPRKLPFKREGLTILNSLDENAVALLEKGENVLLFPELNSKNSIEGFYCTDFWCYPMFRSISESMNKAVPVGTMGLLIDNHHPALRYFPCEEYATYQWWDIISNSRSIIMDGTVKQFRPIIQVIDNFERNHKLGLLFECRILNGKLLVCTSKEQELLNQPEGRQFLFSILKYFKSDEFCPSVEISLAELRNMLK